MIDSTDHIERERQEAREKLREKLILRYATLLVKAGERIDIGVRAAQMADSVIEALK